MQEPNSMDVNEASDKHACKRCGYVAASCSILRRHLQRLRTCVATLHDIPQAALLAELAESKSQKRGVVCAACGKQFASCQSRWNHYKICKKKKDGSFLPLNEKDKEKPVNENQNLGSSFGLHDSGLDIPAVNVTQQATTINNMITHTNHNTLIINDFGKESLEHITTPFLDRCVRRRDKGLVELIEKIHFDPARKQNCNVRVTNRKLPIMQVRQGVLWRYDKKERVLNDLVDKGHGMMQEHFDDHEERIREDMSATMFTLIREWMDSMQDREKKTLESVITDIYILILNAQQEQQLHERLPTL